MNHVIEDTLLMGILLPNTKRLKQLIHMHGKTWEIPEAILGPVPMQCFDNNLGFSIRSLDGKHSRNVRTEDIKIP